MQEKCNKYARKHALLTGEYDGLVHSTNHSCLFAGEYKKLYKIYILRCQADNPKVQDRMFNVNAALLHGWIGQTGQTLSIIDYLAF